VTVPELAVRPPGTAAEALSRRRSQSSQANDVKILEAALREIEEVGVDKLAMTSVARRAGLTTGALYARYESAGELAAALWTSVVTEQHFALLNHAVSALIDDHADSFEELAAAVSAPSTVTSVALELITTARRIDELQEVVFEDVARWMREWDAAPRARQHRRRAQVLFTLGTVWGILLHIAPSRRALDWRPVMARLQWSFAQPYDAPSNRFVADRVQEVRANTGDRVQDALTDAVAAVIARVGLERATVSRISRRANLTSGTIYGRFATKEHLLDEAIVTLLAQRFSDDLLSSNSAFIADAGNAAARIVGGYMSEPRQQWRRFRIETQLAARHHPRIAATLDQVQEGGVREYLEILGAQTPDEQRFFDILARFAQLVPIGLALVDLVTPGLPKTDWRPVLQPLFSPSPTA
jgi:AcrR family transcriptional regulator